MLEQQQHALTANSDRRYSYVGNRKVIQPTITCPFASYSFHLIRLYFVLLRNENVLSNNRLVIK